MRLPSKGKIIGASSKAGNPSAEMGAWSREEEEVRIGKSGSRLRA